MNERKQFESRFQNEIVDMLVLVNEEVSGGACLGKYLRPSLDFVASINVETGEFSEKVGRLEWLVKDSKSGYRWGFCFEQYGIYRIKARKNIPIKLESYMLETMNNCYMVVDVVEEHVKEPQLMAIAEELKKPVVIEDSIGVFRLDRQFSWFESKCKWLDKTCIIYLETDEQYGNTAVKALEILHKLYTDLEDWNQRLCTYAASELLECANDYLLDSLEDGEDAEPITEEVFIRRMEICSITISPDGSMTLYFYDDDMFWGHDIEVNAQIDGKMISADMVG